MKNILNIWGIEVDISLSDTHTVKDLNIPSAHSLHTNWWYNHDAIKDRMSLEIQRSSEIPSASFQNGKLIVSWDLSFQDDAKMNAQFGIAWNKWVVSKTIHHLLEKNGCIAMHACAIFNPDTWKIIIWIWESWSWKTALISAALLNGWKIVSTEMLVMNSSWIILPGNTHDTVSFRAADYIERYLEWIEVQRQSIIQDETWKKCLADFSSAAYTTPIILDDNEVEVIFLNYWDLRFLGWKVPTDLDYITRMLQYSSSEKIDRSVSIGYRIVDAGLNWNISMRDQAVNKLKWWKYKFTILWGDISDFERYLSSKKIPLSSAKTELDNATDDDIVWILWIRSIDGLTLRSDIIFNAFLRITKIINRDLSILTNAKLLAWIKQKFRKWYDFSDRDLTGVDCSWFDLSWSNFNRAVIASGKFDWCNFEWASFVCPSTERTSLKWAKLKDIYAHSAFFSIAKLQDAIIEWSIDMTWSFFHWCSFENASFRWSNISWSWFYQCNLSGTKFAWSNVYECTFVECTGVGTLFAGMIGWTLFYSNNKFKKADLRWTDLSFSQFTGWIMDWSDFSASHGENASFKKISLVNGKFDNSTLPDLELNDVELWSASFQDSDLKWIKISKWRWTRVNFSGSDLSSWEIKKWTNLHWSLFHWVLGEDLRVLHSNLSNSNFSESEDWTRPAVRMRWLNVRNSDLSGSNFRWAYLYRSFFTGDHVENMDLSDTDFTDALLVQAYIASMAIGANFTRANLTYWRLNQSNFTDANFENAQLFMAGLTKTNFTWANLFWVKAPIIVDRTIGLEQAQNLSPILKEWILNFQKALSTTWSHQST